MGARASFPVVSLPVDRVVIVTGANCGIGYEIAKWCAMMGATVILACRSEDKARKAMERMQVEFQTLKANGKARLTDKETLALEFMDLDLASFQSVFEFCEAFKKSDRLLNVLFCNAGLGFGPYNQSADGLEMMLQVNYLSHFLIIAKLLPVMKSSGSDCRIILMSSKAHEMASFNVNTMNYTGTAKDFPELNYYGRSKLYQIMQTFAMARRLKDSNITINCMHPGVVETELWRDIHSSPVKFLIWLSRFFGKLRSPLEGATTGIDIATNPKLIRVTGHYWIDCKITRPSRISRDERKQELLWKETFRFIDQFLTEEEIKGLEGS